MTHRIYRMSFASVYVHYLAKFERKGCTQGELDALICWLMGYDAAGFADQLARKTDFETFFREAPRMNPDRVLVTGLICGVRIEDIEEPLMREIRILDKLVDERAKGRPLDRILRKDVHKTQKA